jgi:hypothetical protein
VKRKQARAISGETHWPNQALIQRYSTAYGWNAQNLQEVLNGFGPLPEAGQEKLIRGLVRATATYQRAAKTTEHVTRSQVRNQLTKVANTAKRLIGQLKDPFTACWLASANISDVRYWLASGTIPATVWDENVGRYVDTELSMALEREGQRQSALTLLTPVMNRELKLGNDCVTSTVSALKEIRDRAEKAVQLASTHMRSGRGGTRHRPSAESQLIKDAITIYSQMGVEYQKSGGSPGFGGPLVRFVQTVGKLCGVSVRESKIKDVWRSRKSKHK